MATAQAWKVLNTDPKGDGGLAKKNARNTVARKLDGIGNGGFFASLGGNLKTRQCDQLSIAALRR